MKPVAWMDEETGCFVYSQYDYEDLDEHGKDGLIPLYTHPVKEQKYEWDYVAFGDGDGFMKITMPFDKWKELIEYVDGKAQEK